MQVTVEPRDNFTILHLRGEFDTFYCALLQKEVDGLIASGVARIALNLRLVKFINSTALGAIIKASKVLASKGGKLVVSRPSVFCKDIMEKVGLDRVVPMFDSDEAAGVALLADRATAGRAKATAEPEDDTTILFAPTDAKRVDHFIPESVRTTLSHPQHGQDGAAGGSWRGLGRMLALDTEGLRFTWNGGNTGLTPFPVAELYNIDFAQVDACAKAIGENADIALGAKVRMSENVIAKHGTEPLKRAIMACEKSGANGKIMCHIGGVETPQLMSQILDTLRPGDVLTHCYSGAPNNANQFTNIVQDGKLLPAALEAKKRGVIFDIGHGGGSFDYTVAEAAMAQGAMPDTISSDIHVFSGNSPGMPYLTWVMSKFMGLGFSLEQVISMATTAPAKIINRMPKLGTLQVGAPGDVSIMDLIEGPVSFVDTRNNKRDGKAYLKPVQTVTAGVPFGRPYHSPFAVR